MSAQSSLSRVLLYSHDTYGLGHLRRNLVLGRQLLGGVRPPRVLLASGSPVIDQVSRPPGLTCVQLPPVVKSGDDEYRSIDPSLSISLVRRARSAVLSDIVARWKPDVLLVDHAPQGMNGELLPVFDELARCSPRTKVVLGLRDILDEPDRVRASWQADGVYDTLEEAYDQILVYGDREMFDIGEAYQIPEPVASRLEYCGYVTGDRPERSVRPPGLTPGVDYVLGTVGGGGDGVEVLIATAHAAASSGVAAVLCTGPLMSDADHRLLGTATASLSETVIVEHLQDVAAVAAGARCVVSRGGYNSLCELVNLGVPTVVVPRVWPRREQLLRARVFASHGLVRLAEAESGGLAEKLMQAIVLVAQPGGFAPELLDLHGRERVISALERTASIGKTNVRPRTLVGVLA